MRPSPQEKTKSRRGILLLLPRAPRTLVTPLHIAYNCRPIRLGGCTDQSRRLNSKVTTTNQLYRCEEFEDVYDDVERDHYDELDEKAIYLDVLADEGEECDQSDKPELPSLRQNVYVELLSGETEECGQASELQPPSPGPVAPSQDENQDHYYECDGLEEKKPDNVYLHAPAECGENTNAADENHDQSTTPQEQDNRSTTLQDQDQDNNTHQQSPVQE